MIGNSTPRARDAARPASRRRALRSILAVATAGAFLAGCSTVPNAAATAADSGEVLSGTVSVATFGGQYKKLLEDYVVPAFKKQAPGVEVIFTESENSEDYLAKAIAEKDGTGSFDIIISGSSGTAKLTDNDLVKDLSKEEIPNFANLKEDYQNPFYAAQIYSAITLAYNENEFPTAPDSWEVLFDEANRGKIGVMSNMNAYWAFAAGSLQTSDPLAHSFADYFDELLKLKGLDAKFYSTNDALGTALQTGEVSLSLGWRARNALLTVDGGEPIGNVVPKEGSLAGTYGASIPLNAPNPQAAALFVDALLSAEAQVGFAEGMGYAPTVVDAELAPDAHAKIGFTSDEQHRIVNISSEELASQQSAIIDRWNEEILNG